MACLKCGSSWTTRWGYDKLSCPECCKQQRAKARRLGKIPSAVVKNCKVCGVEFEAVGGNAIAKSTKCRECVQRDETLGSRRKRYQERVKAGLVVPGKRAAKHCDRTCAFCNAALTKPNQKKYCSQTCFFAARNCGQQSWDRSNQLNANMQRCGVSITPSQKGLSGVLNGFSGFMVRLRAFHRMVAGSRCLHCDASTNLRSKFCSEACRKAFTWTAECRHCSQQFTAVGCRRRICSPCRQKAIRLERKRIKRDRGTYRKRCRKYGGHYNSEVTRIKVFQRDGWRCHVCGKKTLRFWAHNDPREATVDHHPVPLSHGGDHDWHNVRCACRKCNSEKSNRWDGQRRLVFTE